MNRRATVRMSKPMASVESASLPEGLPCLKIFDWLPIPTIVVSQKSEILLTNRACRQIIEHPQLFNHKQVADLPLRWLDGAHSGLIALLSSVNDLKPNIDQAANTFSTSLNLRIEILHSSSAISANLLVSTFNDSGSQYNILSFENLQPNRLPLIRTKSTETQDSRRRRPVIRSASPVSYSGTRSSNGEDELEEKIRKLRDAIYHNEERAGFLLSADNTFCFPNYKGGMKVQPVEIDDVEIFFSSWNLWDQHFTQKVPFPEYPSVFLNVERKKFHNLRYGLKEGGKNIVIEVSGDPLYHLDTDEFLGGVCWIRHLGEHADVMAADLEAGLADFRNICERLPHLLWTITTEGMADYFSPAWYDFTGFTEAQSLGLAFQDAVDPEDMKNLWSDFHNAQITKREVSREAKYKRFDGQWRWMSVRARPLLDSSGKILKWYGTSTDVHEIITERIEAELKQHQLMEMLSLTNIGLFDVSPEGQISVHEGKVGWVPNGKECNLHDLKLGAEEGIGRLDHFVYRAAKGDQESISFEEQIGNRWYKFRLIRDGERGRRRPELKKVIGCSIDITEHRERANLEAENARLIHEATLEIEKSKLKTAFLAHMSHEIRTPIAGIIGLADMIADTKLDSEQKDCVDNLQLSANNLLTIVNDILDLSKIEAGQLQFEKVQYDLHSILRQTLKLFLPSAKNKGIDLVYKGVAESMILLGDPGRVKQILNNLVSNALKFTSHGSICLCMEKQIASIRILVCDTGDGIDADMMAKLFRPFTQGDASTARRHGGTGLGLTISRNLAHGMGGTLHLDSTPGQGTKAILTLPFEAGFSTLTPKDNTNISELSIEQPVRRTPVPRKTDPAKPTKNQDIAGPNGTYTKEKRLVFIVDDNPVNTKIALALVRKLGYETCSAWNGKEALDFLETTSTAPACILMDCQMPLMDGYEATRRLRTDERYAKHKGIPVVALTASAIQGDREKCQASGMDDYLSKPVNKGLLAAMLKKWIPDQSAP